MVGREGERNRGRNEKGRGENTVCSCTAVLAAEMAAAELLPSTVTHDPAHWRLADAWSLTSLVTRHQQDDDDDDDDAV